MYPASTLCAPCQDGDSRARLLTRYTTSKGPLPADRFAERRSTVVPSPEHLPADFMRPSRCRDAPARPNPLSVGGHHGFLGALVRHHGPAIRASLLASATTTTLRLARLSSACSEAPSWVSIRARYCSAARATDQQHAHVGAPALADPRQARLAAGCDLAGYKPQPSSEVTPLCKPRQIADRCRRAVALRASMPGRCATDEPVDRSSRALRTPDRAA